MNKKTSWMISISVLALCGLLLTAACNKKEEQPANTMSEQPAMAPAADADRSRNRRDHRRHRKV